MEISLDATQDDLRAFSKLCVSHPSHAHLSPRTALFSEAVSSLAKTVSPIHQVTQAKEEINPVVIS